MILTVFLFILFLLVATGFLFFFFCFFVPALKSKYYGVSSILSTEKNVTFEKERDCVSNATVRALVNSAEKKPLDRRLTYTALKNCAVFYAEYGSEYADFYGCAGFGDCAAICHQTAIQIQNGIAVVSDLCDGCGECVAACPLGLISLVQKTEKNSGIPAKKDFQFWRFWYRILKRQKEE